MLPTILSHELIEGVQSFLRATFPPSTPRFREAFDEILTGVGRGKLFQGPYLRVSLPFQGGTRGVDFFSRLNTSFPPYKHQEEAWTRLQSDAGQSTLVATGTGSGKTECFLYPILDHVLANPSERGIKAIILYPMNALATDQARRFAKEVHSNPACQGKVRVGLYVGGESDKAKQMSETGVITCREEMQSSPPDILLTNYKMLDYLLIRQDDQPLWRENAIETLRYVVVDELHSFDGAQGTDLACLIRRVKARLQTPKDHLCCVGTSATLGGDDSLSGMTQFAEQIFGESFTVNAIIQESRKSAGEHIDQDDDLEIKDFEPPGPEHHEALSPSKYEKIEDYIEAQIPLWFERSLEDGASIPDIHTNAGRVQLGNMLRRHNFLRTFLTFFRDTGVVEESIFLTQLHKRRGTWDESHYRLILNSFISLCAVARNAPYDSAYFLQIRSEVWMREWSRMVASVHPLPEVRFSMDLSPDHPQQHLPALHCRDCGAMGWGALQKANEEKLIPDLDRFYQAFFSLNPDPRLRFVFPVSHDHEGTEALTAPHFCGACLTLFESKDGVCPACATALYEPAQAAEGVCTFKVESPHRTIQRKNLRVVDKSCPFCDSSSGLTIVGSRAASLTSVALSQLFGSPYNDDKKAMAFSDSVQDASHRAGFFSARTYQIALRTALQKVISERGGVAMSLAQLSETFPSHWQQALGKHDFVGTFIPPTIEWLDEFEAFKQDHQLSMGSTLPSKVEARLRWEVIREFGMQCRIGRTLEKSGAAACHLAAEPLKAAANAVLAHLHDQSASFGSLALIDCQRLLMGLCERLRVNGGLNHRYLKSYLEQKGNEWAFNHLHGEALPRIPKQGMGNRPTFFASFAMKDTFERLSASGSTPTWSERWIEKWLTGILGVQAANLTLKPLIEQIEKALTEAGLWQKHALSSKDGEYAWALNPAQVMVSAEVMHHACQTCGHQVTSSATANELWNEIPCLRHKCTGRYGVSSIDQGSFFGDLYRRGEVVRMRATEHTGMLDRPRRERIEQEFMRQPSRTTDTKLLSCTPTMEMGVDVGDLSTVLLCSVPPEQANYIQRVGRGGRRDGNSLALTVATSSAHDLSFYEEPLKLLAGDVQMPAIFLNAPAVLERQLTAYCLDRWIASTPSASIPNKMDNLYAQLFRETKEEENQGVFPKAFYRHIELNLTDLIGGFLEMFDREELDQASADYLQTFIQGDDHEEGSLCYKITTALTRALRELQALKKKRDKLTRAVADNKKVSLRDEKLDAERDNMLAERQGLQRLIRQINEKQTLNFLTDEGLIPNYAFPEEGVTLQSIILKKPEKDEQNQKLVKLEYEHVRPAEAALSELAPGNSFYVEGRKLTVDQVSIEQDDYEAWHFCRTCAHLEPVSSQSESYSECPRCHCTGWSDTSLKQQMLKMRQVFVTAWDRSVRNLDQKDNRDLTTFNKQTSIDYAKEAISRSYCLKAEGATFAFDFIREIKLREVNFGQDRQNSDSVKIGGKDMQGVGFQVCKACGKIQPPQTNKPPKHDVACKHYGKDTKAEEFERTFLLYRELKSEAIKLLIPSLNQDENIDTQSFVAAIHMGLKAHFGGYLSHLKLSVQQLPIGGGQLRSQHVFVYDSVPGGTGYLKQLTLNGEALIEVLDKAYTALNDCPCGTDPTLDGCYQCIKAYRFRFVHNQISRRTALRQLKLILDHREGIEERSPDESLINPLLESELERRFIESLRQTDGFQVNLELVDDKPGYLLKIHQAAWKIIPQMDLGHAQGVAIPCRPDFILKPLRPSKGMPIAVFLDGFAYHADVELDNNRIADDIAKRNAIRMTDRYLVWSLTWADIRGDHPEADTFLHGAYQNLSQLLREQAPDLAHLPVFQKPGWNNWELLLAHLQHLAHSEEAAPLDHWQTAIGFLSCNFPQRVATSRENLEGALQDLMLGQSVTISQTPDPEFMTSRADHGEFRLISAVPIASLKERSLKGALTALWFDDIGEKPAQEFQREWQDLLRSFNLLQFVPRFVCFTKRMIESGQTSNLLEWLLGADEVKGLEEHVIASEAAESGLLTADQRDELEMLDPSLQPILVPLLSSGAIPWPEFGYDATSASGQCAAAMLEVAWPDQQLGIALKGDDVSAFADHGWSVLFPEDCQSDDLLNRFSSTS